jgi:phosphoribosyl 1,2-cyclic phosphodiesterase
VWEDDVLIILDAGTGMRPLGMSLHSPQRLLMSRRVHVLISHTHWDHIIGLPFFQPLQDPRAHVTVYGLGRAERRLETTLTGSLGQPLFSIPITSTPAKIDFHEVDAYDTFIIAPHLQVTTSRLNHPYRAIGYRVESPSGCLAYVTDTAPFDQVLFGDEQVSWTANNQELSAESKRTLARMRQGALNLMANADWVIFDAQFEPKEYAKRPYWGHSTPEHAIALAVEADAQHLILFHHDPHRTDREIDAIEAVYRARAAKHGLMLSAAREGLILT